MNNSTIFNVCFLNPAFKEVAESIYYGLIELGFTAYFHESTIIVEAQNIVFGSHLIPDMTTIPDDSILFNLEQLSLDSQWCNDLYLSYLKKYRVWDYSLKNIIWLKQNNINSSAKIIPIGYSPKLFRIPKAEVQDIDVLFYGAINERRSRILDELRATGLNVVSLVGVYGNELAPYISRSKVILNLHFYEIKIFEVVRISYLLNNKKAVVSEVGKDTEIDQDLREAIIAADYDELVGACIRIVHDEVLRVKMEEKGYEIFSARSQANILKDALIDY